MTVTIAFKVQKDEPEDNGAAEDGEEIEYDDEDDLIVEVVITTPYSTTTLWLQDKDKLGAILQAKVGERVVLQNGDYEPVIPIMDRISETEATFQYCGVTGSTNITVPWKDVLEAVYANDYNRITGTANITVV